MNTIPLPVLPASLWIMATASILAILMVTFFLYIHYQRRLQAALDTAKDLADLMAQKNTLEADVQSLRKWIEDQKNELLSLEAERKEQEKIRVELAGLTQQCIDKEKELQGYRIEMGELEGKRHEIREKIGRLEEELTELENRKNTLIEQIEQTQIYLRKEEERLSNLEDQSKALAIAISESRSELQSLRIQIKQAESDLAAYQNQKSILERQIAELNQKGESAREHTARILDKRKSLENEFRQLENDFNLSKQKLQRALDRVHELQQEILSLEARKTVLESEIGKLEGGTEDISIDLFVPPRCLSENLFSGPRLDDCDELTMLRKLQSRLRKEGYLFHTRTIYAFHTSLKCHHINPLTVLAGVSGTGKTLLPIKYAEFMGMHHLVIAVQPRWDSPQDMFGFYNYLEKKYKPTELAQALLYMNPYNEQLKHTHTFSERMLIVLLDEMNLARTEYYFSEFLSKLELRRLVSDPKKRGERSKAEIILDTGPRDGSKFSIWVDLNVLFVGTMNEDETTQTLSDKILDRANVLRFGKPMQLGFNRPRTRSDDKNFYLPWGEWKKWIRRFDPTVFWAATVESWICRINDALEKVGRPFGYRVRDVIFEYLANYPGIDQPDKFKDAFADQVEQKIIPKLRGIDLMEQTSLSALDDLSRLISELGDQSLEEAFRNAVDDKSTGLFIWRGVTRSFDSV